MRGRRKGKRSEGMYLHSRQRQLVEACEKQFQKGQKRLQVLGLGVVAQGAVEHGVEARVLGVQHDRGRLVDGRVFNGRSGRVLRPLERRGLG